MAIPSESERIFQKLAEMYGKKTVPFKEIKGRTVFPEEYTGAWVLIERSDGWLSIVEIVGTQKPLKFPLGAIAFTSTDFPAAVDMAMHAVREYMHVYPTLPGARHEIPGEIYGAHLPQVNIDGITYYRDDVNREFRVVGSPEQRISFEDYEKKYFDGYRQLRIYFSGNVATMQGQSGSGVKSYKTTSQDNALQAITFWVHNGVLKPGAGPEAEREIEDRGMGNWLDIVKVKGKLSIADNHNQNLLTEDTQKAVRAIRNWVMGGQLKG